MKNNLLVLISLTVLNGFSQKLKHPNDKIAGNWTIELRNNDLGLAKTILIFNADSNTFTAATRKNADKDAFGAWKAKLGRTFTKDFKGGSFLHIINGKINANGDSTILSGIFTSALGNYYFNGFIQGSVLHAALTTANKKVYGYIDGIKENTRTPLENYPLLFEKCVGVTKQNIYNSKLTNTKEWKRFERKMKNAVSKAQDDLDMVFAFYYNAGKLPFSHYSLIRMAPKDSSSGNEETERYVSLEEKSPQTVYMKIMSFSGTAKEMDSVFNVINTREYKNLIVDLRDNPGGTVEAGMAFATSIANTTFYGGVFLTQKWFNAHSNLPSLNDYSMFPSFTASSFALIISGIHNENGLCLKIIPKEKIYKGNVFILTNRNTASTCEPIVYALKQNKLATIVGETTAGAMLNGEFFDLIGGIKIVIPTADYYASDGYRIDQKGVIPNIKTKPNEALQYVLTKLILTK
jgi:hypothetical protein